MKSLHEKVRLEYEKLEAIACPAMGGEVICFHKSGFNHLLRKGKNPRPRKDVLRRIRLLPLVLGILQDNEVTVAYEKEETACFWRISKTYDSRVVIVVVRQLGVNPKHFFSVMDNKLSTKKSPNREGL